MPPLAEPGGEVGGLCCVQLNPSHVHVSVYAAPVVDWQQPPNKTTRPWARSRATFGLPRGGGAVDGFSWFQAIPSQRQVSPRNCESSPWPPKRSTAPAVASSTIPAL